MRAARLEERITTARYIKVFLDEPDPTNDLAIMAAKAAMMLLLDKLSDHWGLRDTAEIFEKWGLR